MLSPATIALVKATAPALQAHGETITRHFYNALFTRYPQTREFFNQQHQASGSQPRALAGAVVAFAAHVDRLDALASALPLIINKHVALGVLPEHYPIVGEVLLDSIEAVLGAAATPEILTAWGEAYGFLASLLVGAEEQVYRAHEQQPGGWRGPRAFRVARRQRESEVIASLYLEPADGGALPVFAPGQYVTLLLDIDGTKLRRNYSLSDSPGKPWLRISVKREPNGVASCFLHDRVHEGDTLALLPPSGNFVLEDSNRPLVLLTGGVGITPALSMLNAVAGSGRSVRFIHAALHSGTHAFREHVDELARAHANVSRYYVYSEPREGDVADAHGYLTSELLASHLPADRDVDLYFLGPRAFMAAAMKAARSLGVPASQVRYEFFGPLEPLDAA